MAQVKKAAEAPVTEAPAPAPMPQPAPAPEASQASPVPKGKNPIVIIVGIVILIGAAIAGYGYWNGTQIQSYAKKAEGYMNTSKDWKNSMDASDFKGSNTDNVKQASETMKKVKSESVRILDELNKTSAPGKTKALEGYLKDYFGTTKKLGEDLEPVMSYVDALVKVGESMSSLSTLGSSPDDIAKIKKELQDAVDELKKLTPPDSMKDTHNKMVSALEKIVDIFDEMAAAIESGDYSALMDITSQLYGIEGDLGFSDSSFDVFADYKDEIDKVEELEPKINTEINNLKNAGTFVF